MTAANRSLAKPEPADRARGLANTGFANTTLATTSLPNASLANASLNIGLATTSLANTSLATIGLANIRAKTLLTIAQFEPRPKRGVSHGPRSGERIRAASKAATGNLAAAANVRCAMVTADTSLEDALLLPGFSACVKE